MADNTKIEWCHASWNIINGCSVVSPGCTNCYAMKLAGGRLRHNPSRAGLTHPTKAGPVWTGDVRFNEKVYDDPLRWTRPRRIFVCAHGDLFHENVPDAWIDRVFAVMALAPRHTFQVLTKRPERAREYLNHAAARILLAAVMMNRPLAESVISVETGWPLKNVWLGVSAEDQQRAEERIPVLLATPAAVRWLSCEPLLGPVRLEGDWIGANEVRIPHHLAHLGGIPSPKIDWVVVGCESGPDARPFELDWARHLQEQCAHARVAFFCKQLPNPRPGMRSVLHALEQFPPDLQVRQYPEAA